MANNLNVQVFTQIIADPADSAIANILKYVAVDYFMQPAAQYIFDYGVSNNSAATPYPIFVTDDDAITFFSPTAGPAMLAQVNLLIDPSGLTSYFTTYDITKIDPPVGAALSSLTLDDISNGVTYVKFTPVEKTKLDTLAAVAVSGSYSDLTSTPTLATVATSGLYSDLASKPTLSTVAASGAYTDLTGKPTLFSGAYADLTGKPALFSGAYSDLTGKPSLASVATSGAYTDLTGRPTFAMVATSGAYADLTGKPSLATVATSGSYADLSSKPTLPTVQAYEGTTQRLGAFLVYKSATVASNVAVFNFTSDGTSTGTALFPNGPIMDSINVIANDSTSAYQSSWVWSNSNKTLTVTCNKYTTASLLSGILGQAAANGITIKVSACGY